MKRFLLVFILFYQPQCWNSTSFLNKPLFNPTIATKHLFAGGIAAAIAGLAMWKKWHQLQREQGPEEQQECTKLNIQNMALQNKIETIKNESASDIEQYVTKKGNIKRALARLQHQTKDRDDLKKILKKTNEYSNVVDTMWLSSENMNRLKDINSELPNLYTITSKSYRDGMIQSGTRRGQFAITFDDKYTIQIPYEAPIYKSPVDEESFIESQVIVDAVQKELATLEINEPFSLHFSDKRSGENLWIDGNFWIKTEDFQEGLWHCLFR